MNHLSTSVIGSVARRTVHDTQFSLTARTRASHAFTDTIGCIVSGVAEAPVVMARQALSAPAGGPCAVIGGGGAPAGHAALINATAAHAQDYDDTFGPLSGHASAVLVPALLGVAGLVSTSGMRLTEAYLIGLEAQALFGRGLNPGHYAAGWHATSTVGAIGASIGTAWLLGLDEEGMTRAASLAVSMASGLKGQFGTPAKPLHAGLAARNAVEAALLAATGLTGRPDIIEHAMGLEKVCAGKGEKWAQIMMSPDAPHSIESIGLTPKRYPCCAATHDTLDRLLDLRTLHGFDAADVERVDIALDAVAMDNLSYMEPVNGMQARFSMTYCAAVTLLQGVPRLSDFTQEAVEEPARRRLLSLIHPHLCGAEESAVPRHRVTVRLKDGRTLRSGRTAEASPPARTFNENDRRDKYLDCCSRHLDRSDADTLYERLLTLEKQPDLAFIACAFGKAR